MLSLLIIAGFMLFVTFFGRQFGESLGSIGEGVSELLSPKIQPAFIPTVGLEFTPGVWEWWTGAQQWLEGIGITKDPGLGKYGPFIPDPDVPDVPVVDIDVVDPAAWIQGAIDNIRQNIQGPGAGYITQPGDVAPTAWLRWWKLD